MFGAKFDLYSLIILGYALGWSQSGSQASWTDVEIFYFQKLGYYVCIAGWPGDSYGVLFGGKSKEMVPVERFFFIILFGRSDLCNYMRHLDTHE